MLSSSKPLKSSPERLPRSRGTRSVSFARNWFPIDGIKFGVLCHSEMSALAASGVVPITLDLKPNICISFDKHLSAEILKNTNKACRYLYMYKVDSAVAGGCSGCQAS
jgi:hypothetical protein